jgi:hypothetical protein
MDRPKQVPVLQVAYGFSGVRNPPLGFCRNAIPLKERFRVSASPGLKRVCVPISRLGWVRGKYSQPGGWCWSPCGYRDVPSIATRTPTADTYLPTQGTQMDMDLAVVRCVVQIL